MLRIVAFLAPLLLAAPLLAGNHHCAVQLQSGLAVVPFAVPVATPIAVVNQSPFVYGFSSAGSYGAQAQATVKTQSSEDALVDRLAAKLAARLGLDPVKPAAAPEAPSLVTANCLGCHGATKQAGGVRFDAGLTDELRLRAVAAMMHDDAAKRMPKGKSIDAATLGRLIQEFTTRPKVAAQAELPAEPK